MELELPECVFNKVIDLLVIFGAEPAPASPTDEELFYLVYTYLVTPAIDQCGAIEVDADESTSDILAILQSLSSPTFAFKTSQITSPRAATRSTSQATQTSRVAPTPTLPPIFAFLLAVIGCVIAIASLVAGY